ILPTNNLISIIFEPFLNQFKRDAEKYQITCEARKKAGSKGGKQKVANASKCKQKVAKVADNKNDNKNKNDNDIKNDNDLPIFINKDLFNSFIEMRVKIKKPLTDKAKELLLKDLTNFENLRAGNANIALENSIKNSWQGVFEPKPNNQQQQPKQTFLTKQQIEQNQNMQIFSNLQKKHGSDNA
ncbi:MAG: hypothetical protein EBV32_05665, partial [Proteobacteria bacterium]|nr:hypothetical protein [Candidatus Fonsibacter lacus]NBP60377.1 hypothetical protein [Pseudomonadota bacterium]